MAIIKVVSGFLIGMLLTVFMVYQNPLQLAALVLALVCLLGTVYLVGKANIKFRTVIVYLALILAGYLLTSALVSGIAGNMGAEKVVSRGESQQTAVLLLSPGEIREFNPHQAVYRLKVLKETCCYDIKWWNMPFKVYSLKRAVKKLGDNPFPEVNQSLYNKVQENLGAQFRVYNANLLGPPYIEWVVKEIIRAGHSKMVVLCNFLVFEPYRDFIDSKIRGVLEKSEGDMEVLYTFPLWNHDAIAILYENRIMEKVQENVPEDVGIVLVAKGASDRACEKYQDGYKREQVFFNKVKENLVKNGYDSRKVKVAYLRYQEPGLREAIDYLLDSGVRKLVIAAAGLENYNIESQLAVKKIIGDSNIPRHVEVEYVDCWGDSDLLVKALVDRLRVVNVN